MKFKIKEKPAKISAKIGEKRIIRIFLWKLIKHAHFIYWLEFVTVQQEYVEKLNTIIYPGGLTYEWKTIKIISPIL
jgi:hypothetical protein